MREVAAAALADLARGAAILGSGGGGDPYVGRLLAQQAILEHGPVRLVGHDEVPGDAVVAAVSMMGAPTVQLEKLPSSTEFLGALDTLSAALGLTVTHLTCVEVGGVNSLVPFAAAAVRSLPVIDADAMGRAFPRLNMKLPGLIGIGTAPMAVADDKGNVGVLRTVANVWSERLARAMTIEMGSTAGTAQLVMRGADVSLALALGTLSWAERIGRAIREAGASHADPIRALLAELGGRALFTGKVIDLRRTTETGFVRGRTVLAGLGEDDGRSLEVDFQNEHLVAWLDGRPVATVPDIITFVEPQTGEPVNTEVLRYGMRVTVVSAPCDPRWRTAAGLAVVSPRVFGYDLDYVPAEDLAR